jgi:transposase-like protein
MTTRKSGTRSRRRRWSAGEKAQHLAAFRRSEESVRVFCARVGVPTSTFALWLRAARGRPAAAKTPSRFARVQVVPAAAAPSVTPLVVIRAAHGVALEVAGLDVATLVAVLRGVTREPGA